MTFNLLTLGNMNAFDVALPQLPPVPQATFCNLRYSPMQNVSLFTPMPTLNLFADNTLNFLNNTGVPKTEVLKNTKTNYSSNNIFSSFFTTPILFPPIVPAIPMFNFKFTQPQNMFSFFNAKKTPAKTFSFTSNSAKSISSIQTTSLSEVAKIYNAKKGIKLANEAIDGLKHSQKGYCARAVKTAIQDAGLGSYESGHAYQCPDILRRNPNFKEVKVKGSDLEKLPAGCILAYNKGDAGYNPDYGHIEIKGQGNQAIHFTVNNHIQKSDNVRVFVPV